MDPIYLDYNATTPLDPWVIDAMRPYLEKHYGNPSSNHLLGVEAKRAIEKARTQVASLINARNDEIIFTSGGTESDNFAIKGVAYAKKTRGNHIITTCIEHPAVSEVCKYLEGEGFAVSWLPVDEYGMVDPSAVEKAIKPETILISVMHANNETGTIQPIEKIGAIARSKGILFHTDAAQSVGKIPVDVEKLKVDLLTIAGHKLYAPKGVGVLYIRRGVKLVKLMHGADHESNFRAGTENVMQIVGLGAAAEAIGKYELRRSKESEINGVNNALSDIRGNRDLLYQGVLDSIPEVRINGHPEMRLPNTLSLGFPGVSANEMLAGMKGIAASAGAACHAGQTDISGVLSAMRVPMEYAMGTIRFSLGRMTTLEEIKLAVQEITGAYYKLKGNPLPTGSDAPLSLIRLTEYTQALGCACKIRPQLLEELLKSLPVKANPDILVGHETSDDAAVYRLDEQTAIVQSVDFIPPVVDDPYMYGAIAAANALSDIYAMGGKPVFALSIVGFPERKLPVEVLQQIMKGADDKTAEAGIQIIGGHSIEDSEPKFGLVVTGIINPGKILRNSTAKAGDVLILTKPLGSGIITTAIKRGYSADESFVNVMKVMAELNRVPAEIMAGFDVRACTDISGFGLLGHLKEMVCGAGLHARVFSSEVPVLQEVWDHSGSGNISGGTKNNLSYVSEMVKWDEDIPEFMKFILADAQTSGGLLIALPEQQADGLLAALHEAGVTKASRIGKLVAGSPGITVSGLQSLSDH